MILAGTSERGCCNHCKTPYERIVEKDRQPTRPGADTKVTGTESAEHGNRDPERHVTATKTIGWKQACQCQGHGDPVPCVVMDIFSGTATVGAVATSLGRKYIGLELSAAYAEMARVRINKGASRPSAAAQVKPVKSCARQTSMFD